MLRLTTLGAIDLRDRHGHAMRDLLTQPKRVALLAYLAVEGRRGPLSRDRLMALFWPESDEARARNALSQALHHLRQSLGPGVLESIGATTVGVNGERLWCDAAVFTEALERGEVELALDLYRGEFCPALFVSGAADVEEWLGAQRRRLRGQALAATLTLAERLAARGDVEPAARAARRALALQPDDEGDLRALLALLERCGDPAGAVSAYDDYARRLAETRETEPAEETRQLGEAMRRRHGVGPAPGAAPPAAPVATGGVAATATRGLRRWRGAGAAAAVVLLLVAWWLARHRAPPPSLDPRLVMVAPFRATGADSGLGFLREGMLDLLQAEFTGEGGLRASDPRTVLGAWARRTRGRGDDLPDSAAIGVARSIGAGRLLVGSLVGRSDRMTLTARLLETRRGAALARATASGPLDSLPALVEALAARLLSEGAGEPVLRLPSLAGVPLPALRAYLDGQRVFRAGQYELAVGRLREAVELDSSFAMAWARLVWAADWLPGGADVRNRVSPVAWALRGHLSDPDRAVLVATLGSQYPRPSTRRQIFETWQRAVAAAPERPEAWYGLGDSYFHLGRLLGRDSGFVNAETDLARAAALDSSFAAPLEHLAQIAIFRRDTAAVRRLARVYRSRDSTSDVADYVRWHVTLALGDSAGARRYVAALDTLPVATLLLIAGWSQIDGVGVETAWQAAREGVRRAMGEEVNYALRAAISLATNAGRFGERHQLVSRLFREAHVPLDSLGTVLGETLWMDGDPAAGIPLFGAPGTESRTLLGVPGTCWRVVWRVAHGTAPGDTVNTPRVARDCLRSRPQPLEVRVLAGAAAGDTALGQWLAALDSARVDGIGSGGGNVWSEVEGALLLYRHEYARALEAVRRRELGAGDPSAFWAPLLRLEGRAAALAGDTAAAIRAYRHYLALRFDPDPGVRSYADSVRTALALLTRTADR